MQVGALRRRARYQRSDGGLPLGLELDAAVGRDRDLLAWLAESNKSSGACPDTLGSKLQRMGSLTHIEGGTL